jgi:hypothetical protein
MACLFAVFAGIFPRLGLLIIWIARPARVDAAFDTWLWPLLGLMFMPFVILWQAGGLSGADWFWVALAGLFDIAHWVGGWTQRRQAPGYPTRA